MKVSVIIPVYNGRDVVLRAIESVWAQTLEDVELIVVDDASTDGTREFVEEVLAEDSRAACIGLPRNAGPSAARNAGCRVATGDWISILDADDYFLPDRLERLIRHAQSRKLDIVADGLLVSSDFASEEPVQVSVAGPEPIDWNFYEHFANDGPGMDVPYGLLKPVFRAQFLRAVNVQYNENYRNGEDFDFLAELLLAGGRAEILPYCGYAYLSRYCTYQYGKVSIGSSLSRFTRDPGDLVAQSAAFLRKHSRSLTPLQAVLVRDRCRRLARSKNLFDLKCAINDRRFLRSAVILARHPHLGGSLWRFVARLLRQRAGFQDIRPASDTFRPPRFQ